MEGERDREMGRRKERLRGKRDDGRWGKREAGGWRTRKGAEEMEKEGKEGGSRKETRGGERRTTELQGSDCVYWCTQGFIYFNFASRDKSIYSCNQNLLQVKTSWAECLL